MTCSFSVGILILFLEFEYLLILNELDKLFSVVLQIKTLIGL